MQTWPPPQNVHTAAGLLKLATTRLAVLFGINTQPR